MATKAGWIYLGGKTRRYRNIATGEEISRRQYDKLSSPLSYEAKAKHNRILNPEKSILRPARGRKSELKKPAWAQEAIAEQRLAQKKERERVKQAEKEQREIERRNQRLTTKKRRVRKVKKHLIPKGQISWRLSFNDYAELKTLVKDARATGVVFAYALGLIGVDVRVGIERHVWVMGYTSIRELISENDFEEMMEDALAEKIYLRLSGYFVQFALEKSFVKSRP